LQAALSGSEQETFWSYQRWLGCVTKGCVVPFGEALAGLVPADAIRMRRDFRQLLSTIKTLSVLTQEKRQKTPDGLIIATVDDYAEARRLLAPLFDSIAVEGVTDAIRETVTAVPESEEISLIALAKQLNLSKSTVSWRVRQAVKGGFLKNLEFRKGYTARLLRGDPLPDSLSALPEPEKVMEAFESEPLKPSSNTFANTDEPLGGDGLSEQVFDYLNLSDRISEEADILA
jgi:hypothetical protein